MEKNELFSPRYQPVGTLQDTAQRCFFEILLSFSVLQTNQIDVSHILGKISLGM